MLFKKAYGKNQKRSNYFSTAMNIEFIILTMLLSWKLLFLYLFSITIFPNIFKQILHFVCFVIGKKT